MRARSPRPRLLRRLAYLTRSLADAQQATDPLDGPEEVRRGWFLGWCRGRLGLWWWHRRFDMARLLDPRERPELPLLLIGPDDVEPRLVDFRVERLLSAGWRLVTAIDLTRQYVGYDALPALPGWSWFDAVEDWKRATGEVEARQVQP